MPRFSNKQVSESVSALKERSREQRRNNAISSIRAHDHLYARVGAPSVPGDEINTGSRHHHPRTDGTVPGPVQLPDSVAAMKPWSWEQRLKDAISANMESRKHLQTEATVSEGPMEESVSLGALKQRSREQRLNNAISSIRAHDHLFARVGTPPGSDNEANKGSRNELQTDATIPEGPMKCAYQDFHGAAGMERRAYHHDSDWSYYNSNLGKPRTGAGTTSRPSMVPYPSSRDENNTVEQHLPTEVSMRSSILGKRGRTYSALDNDDNPPTYQVSESTLDDGFHNSRLPSQEREVQEPKVQPASTTLRVTKRVRVSHTQNLSTFSRFHMNNHTGQSGQQKTTQQSRDEQTFSEGYGRADFTFESPQNQSRGLSSRRRSKQLRARRPNGSVQGRASVMATEEVDALNTPHVIQNPIRPTVSDYKANVGAKRRQVEDGAFRY